MTTARRFGGGAFSPVALALSLTAATLGAQSLPRRVDCGDLNGWPTGEAGYELLSQGQAPPGVSLQPAPLDTVHVAGNQPNFYGEFPLAADFTAVDADQLDQTHRLTALMLADPSVLRIDGLTPSTSYRVKLELGALSPWSEIFDFFNPPYWAYISSVSREVRVERRQGSAGWRTAASGIRCSSSYKGPTFESILGAIVDVWVLADSNASGRLELRLSTDGADPLFLSGFELHAHEALPIVYRRDASGPLKGALPAASAFVARFNAGDLDGAESLAGELGDPWLRGVAQLHLLGWLDGSRDGRPHLLEQSRAALTLAQPTHPGAAWLLDELDAYDRAQQHLFASGRTVGHTCADQGGLGFLDTACGALSQNIDSLTRTNVNAHIALRELAGLIAAVDGATVLEDLVDWNAGSLTPDVWEPSPLVFQAAKQSGTTLASMNPHWSLSQGADGQAFADLRDDLLNGFVDLGFAETDFVHDHELRLFQLYVTQAQLPVNWPIDDYQDVLSEQQLEDAWWGAEVALPDDVASAPSWANLLRKQRTLLRALAHYWLVDRLAAGEFGGGLGDDVELLAQFGKLFVGHQGPGDRRALDGVDAMVRWTLGGSGDVQDGYFAGQSADVEHTAEYTTNTWSASASAFGQTATAAQIALQASEHLRHAADPAAAFAGFNNLGRLHFRSYYVTSAGPDALPEHAYDTLLNGRAMLPGWATARRGQLAASHPLVTDMRLWAEAWRNDALTPSATKPLGWYGPVRWPSGALGNGGWWTFASDPNEVSELANGVHSYTLDLLRAAYRTSTASDRWRLLLPGLRMFRSVMAWEDAGKPAGSAPGSEFWAAALFKSSPRFGPIIAAWRGDLQSDPSLTTLSDPQAPGQTYVDAALVARMQTWLIDEFNGQLPVTRYVNTPIQPCGVGATSKSMLSYTGSYANTIPYYRVLFPLITKHVIHTDRIALGAGLSNLAVAETGANLIEGIAHQPMVRWRDLGEQDQDLVVQCNYRDAEGTVFSAFVYNFEPQPVTTTLQLDVGLVPGLYALTWGPGDLKCDLFQPGTPTTSVLVDKRGAGTQRDLTLAPGLSLLRVERVNEPGGLPAGYDLAVDTPSASLRQGDQGLELLLEVRVSNPASVASPPATVALHVAPMAEDGSLTSAEFLLVTFNLPSLAACTGWTPDERVLSIVVPLGTLGLAGDSASPRTPGRTGPESQQGGVSAGPPGAPSPAPILPDTPGPGLLATTLLGSPGLRLRALVTAGADEGDRLNNEVRRGWTFAEVQAATALAGH